MLKRIFFSVIVVFAVIVVNAQQKIVSPEFPNGKEALQKYLNKELSKRSLPDDLESQGVVAVFIEVDSMGQIQEPLIGISLDPTLDSIALSIVAAMPKWVPGSIDGKPVNMRTGLRIPFMSKRERESDQSSLQMSVVDLSSDVKGVESEEGHELSPFIITEVEVEETEEVESISIADLDEGRVKIQVAIKDIESEEYDGEEYGIDIAELEDYKVIVEDSPDEKPFEIVEQMPHFVGGEAEMSKFIHRNLVYPTAASGAGIQGRVVVRFVVQKDGNLSNVKVVRGIDPECDKEAVRVVKAMPKWKPGKQNGKEVPVYFTLPFIFKLD
ncbi:energy transducer TonB [Dysgonomonas sp. Marseille-P4361]|uniref:energy transducer TonB n=1 Tax=Dysgonomonas sp. Marseille-P4361 TaxID=2161820 RepID=UPI00210081A3|nr:energy transducer TonB [Dysgonomonas sp. Marseille-P4361]